MKKELIPGKEYATLTGIKYVLRTNIHECSEADIVQSGATRYVKAFTSEKNSERPENWYWVDGPMAGRAIDYRNLTNFKEQYNSADLLLTVVYQQVQLQLL